MERGRETMNNGKKFIEVRKKNLAEHLQQNPETDKTEIFPCSQKLEEEITLTTSKNLVKELRHWARGSYEDKKSAYQEGNLEQTPYWYGDSYKSLSRLKTRIKIKTVEELTSTTNLLEMMKDRNPKQWPGFTEQSRKACERMYEELQKETNKRDLQ